MVLARMTKWTFKPGKRDSSFRDIDSILDKTAKSARGFRGMMSLLSRDDPSVGVVITLWSDDESLRASEMSIVTASSKEVMDDLAEPPAAQTYELFTAKLKSVSPSSG